MMRAMILAALLVGCGESMVGGDAGAAPGDAGAQDASPDDGGPIDGAVVDSGMADTGVVDGGADEPRVYVHLRATHAVVPHSPSTSGQTPRDWRSGIRSLHLLRDADDQEPVLIFSHGDGYVEASYDDGADTVVGSAAIADLPTGTFTIGRAVHTHVRFTIDATVHTPLGPAPGELEGLLALSDRVSLDGTERARGWYRAIFRTAGMEYPSERSGYEIAPASGGGFTVAVEDGETAYYFPILLTVSNDIEDDVQLVFEVNVHEGFRWTDQDMTGYTAGTFDTTAVATEPVVQAGANSFAYAVE